MNNRELMRNGSGCLDLTAYQAINHIEAERKKMQRAKKKKPKKKKVVMGTSEIDKLKRDISNQLTDKMGILIIVAAMDVVGLNDEQVGEIIERTNRYSDYISQGKVSWDDMKKAIERGTGVSMKGW